MKKKILFIIGTLQSGGVSKSMINLLESIDKERYDIELLVLCMQGSVLHEYIPQNVKVIYNPTIEALHNALSGIKYLCRQRHLLLAVGSMIRLILSVLNKSWAGRWLAYLMPCVSDQDYDLIVDYGGQQQLYYMINKLRGKKKVTFFHSDYSKWDYYYSADKIYFPKVDKIFTISEICQRSLIEYFPAEKNKIEIIENISRPNTIYKMAEQKVTLPQASHLFVSLGHVSKSKGFDYAIEVAKNLKNKGIDFKWLFIGKLIDMNLKEQVEQLHLENEILFLGVITNPYPYIKSCEIFIHLSKFEGKSIALDEAKILCKPIVVTNFSTVHDQFEDGVNASIAEFDVNQISSKITTLLNNKQLQDNYIAHLKSEIKDNSEQNLEKIYQLL